MSELYRNFIELEALEQVPDGIRIISPPYRHPEIDKIGNVKDWIFLSDFWLIDTKNYVMILSVVHGSFLILEYFKVHETDDDIVLRLSEDH